MKSKESEIEEIELGLLLEAIFQRYHYDFRDYSPASLRRRLTQACLHFGVSSFSQLQHLILHQEGMMVKMLQFLTVQVSEMFRDPTYFRALREKVLPHLKTYPSLKVWIAGCSTGEELYSMVILFREEGLEDRTMFYATDINTESLEKAQAGIYELDRLALFSANHRESGGRSSLSDYYSTGYGRAIFDKTLRKRAVFSDHSLVSDAVFAETQLVSCRNVLIYFNRELQDRAIGLFKDSLSRKAFLGIGSKESLRFSSHARGFSEFDRVERIYQKEGGE